MRGVYIKRRFHRRSFKKRRGGKTLSRIQKRSVRTIVNRLTRGDMNISYLEFTQLVPVFAVADAPLKLVQLAQGDAEGQRTANRALLKKIDIDFWLSGANTNTFQTTAEPKVRMVLFTDNASNGDTVTNNELFAATANNLIPYLEHIPEWNTTKKRYKILKDRLFSLQTPGVGVAATPTFVLAETQVQRWSRSFGKDGLLLQYDGAASTDNTGSMVYMAAFSQTGLVYLNMHVRCIFAE